MSNSASSWSKSQAASAPQHPQDSSTLVSTQTVAVCLKMIVLLLLKLNLTL
jgi:hypothetical protein